MPVGEVHHALRGGLRAASHTALWQECMLQAETATSSGQMNPDSVSSCLDRGREAVSGLRVNVGVVVGERWLPAGVFAREPVDERVQCLDFAGDRGRGLAASRGNCP